MCSAAVSDSTKSLPSSIPHVSAAMEGTKVNALLREHRQSGRSHSESSNTEVAAESLRSIKVFIAYYSGLEDEAINVTVRLTPGLTVKDIVATIVHHVNHLARTNSPDNPFYTDDELDSFYMVVVAANKEILLRDHFCPIDLQPPFRFGRFYVSRRIKELRNSVETML